MKLHRAFSTLSFGKNTRYFMFLLGALLVLIIRILITPSPYDLSFSLVGDEYSFFNAILELKSKNYLANPFSAGVYSGNSKLATLIQAIPGLFIKDQFLAFKLSTIILPFIISILMFLWIKSLIGLEVAFISTSLVLFSHYFLNFAMIPYPNLQGTCGLIFLFWLITIAHNSKKSILFNIFVGITLGINFYLYYGAVFPAVIAIYAHFLMRSEQSNIRTKNIVIWIISYLLVIFPGFYDEKYISNLFFRASHDGLFNPYTRLKVVANLFLAPWSLAHESHFVYKQFLDNITGGFLFLGILICLFRFRNSRYSSILSVYVIINFAIGLTNAYDYVTATRSHFTLIPCFAMSGIAIWEVAKLLKHPIIKVIFISILFWWICILNYVRSIESRIEGSNEIICLLKVMHKYPDKGFSDSSIPSEVKKQIDKNEKMLTYVAQLYKINQSGRNSGTSEQFSNNIRMCIR